MSQNEIISTSEISTSEISTSSNSSSDDDNSLELKQDLVRVCKESTKFWEAFGENYAYYFMGKHAKKKQDIWEREQSLFYDSDDSNADDRLIDAFNNTYSQDGKNSLDILKAIYYGKFEKARGIMDSMDTSPREDIFCTLVDIDKRFDSLFN